MRRLCLFFVALKCWILPCAPLAAQSTDTLPDVWIVAARFDQTGFTNWRADTNRLAQPATLAERLLLDNPILIRSNAPGTLATVSARGAGANRTAIIWEGLNLLSPQNGVTDLSLIPVWPDDDIEVRYGGQSAAFSSGAIGGSIITSATLPRRDGWNADVRTEAGSFDRYAGAAQLGWRGPRLSSNTRVWGQRATFDFPFKNTTLIGAPIVRQANNSQRRIDLQQHNQLVINDKTILRTALWHQQAHREIPPAMTQAASDTWQRDRNTRMVATLDHAPTQQQLWRIRAAWNDEAIRFRLGGGKIDSSRAQTALVSVEYTRRFGQYWSIKGGLQTQRQWAQADGYADTSRWWTLQRSAAWSMVEFDRRRIRMSMIVRQEWFDSDRIPIVWSWGGMWSRQKDFAGGLRWHVSNNFNVPTFNDRFWRAWGNPDLKPESGLSADIGTFQRYKIDARRAVTGELTVFALHMRDWILWQPGTDGIFRPSNLRAVRSVGGEAHIRYEQRTGKNWRWIADGRYQYVQATNQASYDNNESVVGKDLTYTPRHAGAASLTVTNRSFSTFYVHTWTGRRFTSSDNEYWLDGYGTGTFGAQYRLGAHWALDTRIDNMWNTAWQSLAGRPMPGRAWNVGVRYTF
jgi:vitamin B12 transporter